MSLNHLTPLDHEYYEAVCHANSDGTTPGFFKVPPMPYGFMHRLDIEDFAPPNPNAEGDEGK